MLDNALSLISPLTGALDCDGNSLTLDAAGATTVQSTAALAWTFTPGAKTGTPGTTGAVTNWAANTYTDNNTAGSGTATAYVAHAFQRPTLAATNSSVTTTDAATVYIANDVAAGTNETLTNTWALWVDAGNVRLDGATSSRTNTVATPLTIQSVTSGAPAAGIGTGILIQAESDDENPSNVGQIEAVFSDTSTGSEDSYFQLLLRVAGAALTSCYRFAATGAFNAIFTHANTAARTYTLPNFTGDVVVQSGTAGVMSALNDDSTTTTAHGLGAVPDMLVCKLTCLSADLGYTAGDVVYQDSFNEAGVGDVGVTMYADATNTYITLGLAMHIVDKTTFNVAAVDETKWSLTVVPYVHA